MIDATWVTLVWPSFGLGIWSAVAMGLYYNNVPMDKTDWIMLPACLLFGPLTLLFF